MAVLLEDLGYLVCLDTVAYGQADLHRLRVAGASIRVFDGGFFRPDVEEVQPLPWREQHESLAFDSSNRPADRNNATASCWNGSKWPYGEKDHHYDQAGSQFFEREAFRVD